MRMLLVAAEAGPMRKLKKSARVVRLVESRIDKIAPSKLLPRFAKEDAKLLVR